MFRMDIATLTELRLEISLLAEKVKDHNHTCYRDNTLKRLSLLDECIRLKILVIDAQTRLRQVQAIKASVNNKTLVI
jgi:hypothetical protein